MTETNDTISYSMTLPIEQVRVKPGHNPRRRFPKSKHEELCLSIKQDGLIHPIAVRKMDDGFEIIAGERRWRAVQELGLTVIDAKVFECSELVARRMSRVENLNREDLTVPEEAYLAQDQVDDCEGDYELAARTLGWSLSKLRHRLQLLHASKAVMDALMEGEIMVGHAELLSTLPVEQQEKTLAKVVEFKATINQLREQLQGFSIPLEQGKFDKEGCRDCRHNSSQQSSLFAEHIDAARCTNATCFGEKTAAWIEVRRGELKDEYPSVELHTEALPGKHIPLVMHGSTGVGREQYDACRSCAFRSCVIDNRVGTTAGNVEGPLCGNAACNTEKAAAYQASIAPAAPAVQESDQAPASPSASTVGKAGRTSSSKASKPTSKTGAQTAETPKAAKEEYQNVLRRAVAAHVTVEPRILLSLAAYGLFKLGKGYGGLAEDDLPEAVRNKTGDAAYIKKLLQLDKDQLQAALVSMSESLLGSSEGSVMDRLEINRAIVKLFSIDPAPFVVVNESFLKNHTVPAIQQVLDESGFTSWHKSQPDGEKKHKALMSLGKAKLIEGVLAAGFDFTGYVPAGVTAEMRGK